MILIFGKLKPCNIYSLLVQNQVNDVTIKCKFLLATYDVFQHFYYDVICMFRMCFDWYSDIYKLKTHEKQVQIKS